MAAVALLLFIMAITVPGVAFMMYPILMQDAETKGKEGLAAWYVGSRITEGAVFVVALLGLFSLLALSKEFAAGGAAAASGSSRSAPFCGRRTTTRGCWGSPCSAWARSCSTTCSTCRSAFPGGCRSGV